MTKTPTATKSEKKYQLAPASKARFGPKAPPDFVEPYLQAMQKLAVAPPPNNFSVAPAPRVILKTSKGEITLQLDTKTAPLHVKSFVFLAQKKFFDGTTFHNQLEVSGKGRGKIIEGGDPLTRNPVTRRFAGLGGPGYTIPLESGLKHDPFVIAAARSNDPNSAGSLFYFTQSALHSRDGQYSVFGKVVDGTTIVSKLAQGDTLLSARVLDAQAD